MNILVTGVAGFIGSHVALYLLARGDDVIGIDNLNDYYDVTLKQARLKRIADYLENKGETDFSYPQSNNLGQFSFIKMDVAQRDDIETLFSEHQFDKVVHLAAQAGVRYSIDNPHAYIDSNIVGFINILEGCRHNKVEHLTYASSSSVYGANESMPFSVTDNVDHPLSLYAASKKANELMAHTYSHLYGIATTGLRFFTVYGPWGRPDMSPFLFADAIVKQKPLKVFNYGKHKRDFTYIDDIVNGIIKTLDHTAQGNENWSGAAPDPSSSKAPWRIYNIGNQTPVELLDYIETIEKALGKTTEKILLPLQAGDVPDTYADVEALVNDVGYRPSTDLSTGINKFITWYLDYHQIK
ncbi:MAG: NAD-dependent epimerase [Alteromonadaceae bacterium]|nr:NAD-dependent epimerase [Alteromonadaceae bacterium]